MSYSYDVFGAIRSQTGTSANYWLFTGEQRDSGSNFYYLRARYYDSAIGRFLSQDSLPTGNLYGYAGNNPVNFVDPYGLFGWSDIKDAAWDVVDAVEEYAVPVATQCAIWGVGGAIAGGVGGAAAGCAAGGGLVIADALIGPNPVTACAAWAGAGFMTGGIAGAAVLCVTGAASYFAPDTPAAQCGVWLAGGFTAAKVVGSLRNYANPHAVRAGVAGCLAGALSVNQPGIAHAGAAYPGKE